MVRQCAVLVWGSCVHATLWQVTLRPLHGTVDWGVVPRVAGGSVASLLGPRTAIVDLPPASEAALRPYTVGLERFRPARFEWEEAVGARVVLASPYSELNVPNATAWATSPTHYRVRWRDGAATAAITAFLRAHPSVLWIEPVRPHRTHNKWVVGRIGRPPNRSHWQGQGQTLTIVDTGLDTDHCMIVDPHHDVLYGVVSGFTPTPLTLRSTHATLVAYLTLHLREEFNSPTGRETDRRDVEGGHGTHVSGSAVGRDCGDGFGGAAPAAKLLFVDAGHDGAHTNVQDQVLSVPDHLKGILATSYEVGSRVLSLSWGVDSNDYLDLCRQLDEFVADHPDYVVVVAAGNDGQRGNQTVGAPATCKNVVGVGATLNHPDAMRWMEDVPNRTLTTNGVAVFSSRGFTKDGRTQPLCVAPGLPVVSARSGGGLVAKFGTSQAAPFVAAAAAKLRQWLQAQDPDASPSSALVRALLLSDGTAHAVPSRADGYGRCVLDPATLPPFVWYRDDATIRPLAYREWTFDVQAGGNLGITLAWNDPPSAPTAKRHLIHNLDLTVQHRGSWVHGNGGIDVLNNHERVVLTNVRTGERIVVRVEAEELTSTQPVALVVSGTAALRSVATVGAGHRRCLVDDATIGTLVNGSECRRLHCAAHHAWIDGRCVDRRGAKVCPLDNGQGLFCDGRCVPSRCHEGCRLNDGRCQCPRIVESATVAQSIQTQLLVGAALVGCVLLCCGGNHYGGAEGDFGDGSAKATELPTIESAHRPLSIAAVRRRQRTVPSLDSGLKTFSVTKIPHRTISKVVC